MHSQWRFTPQEFLLLWPQTGVARLPFPIQLRDPSPTVNERDHGARCAQADLERGGVLRRGRLDADLEHVLRTLVAPTLCCTAFGFYGQQPHELVRVRVAHAGGVGVLAVQLPGPAADVGGDVALSITNDVPAAVVAALPAAPPGREQSAAWERPAPPTGDYFPVQAVPDRAQRSAERFQRLVAGPFEGAGQLIVTARDRDGEARKANVVHWFDRPGDGRYVAVHERISTVRPADNADLVRAVREQLDAVRR